MEHASEVGEDLQECAEGEEGAQREVVGEVRVCDGGDEPAQEGGEVSGMLFVNAPWFK